MRVDVARCSETSTYTFLFRERLEAVCELRRRRRRRRSCCRRCLLLLLLLVLLVYHLLDADVIDHVVSTAYRQSATQPLHTADLQLEV